MYLNYILDAWQLLQEFKNTWLGEYSLNGSALAYSTGRNKSMAGSLYIKGYFKCTYGMWHNIHNLCFICNYIILSV